MLADKLSGFRQSHDMKASAGVKMAPVRDSGKTNIAQYSIETEIQENNQKMLEQFKQNSGFYHNSPKKQKRSSPQKQQAQNTQPSVQVGRIYLFGNKNGDYFTKDQDNLKTKMEDGIGRSTTATQTNSNKLGATSTTSSISTNNYGKYEAFLKEILQTLGVTGSNDEKLQFSDLISTAHGRFIEMKSNGRWQLIKKYFKGNDDDLGQSNNRSCIKKRSILINDSQIAIDKKKVKLLEPETVSKLIKIKNNLQNQLESNLKSLTEGFTFEKYCYNCDKVQQIKVYMSYDMKCLAWQAKGKEPKVQNMQEYSGITDGARSKNYQRYLNKGVKIDEQLAFSIILKNRTLDLLAINSEQKSQFIQALKFMKSMM